MGLLNSLFGKDARKFINRKDSDAGEAGQALEKLRSSLFDDIQTSEGAKRQQQRLCGPSVAMTFNFVVSVAIILSNKLVMGKIGFYFPILLTLIHYTCSWILLAIFKALSLLPVSPPSQATPISSLFSLSVIIAISTGLANISLKHNSVGFYQMTKIAVTPLVVLAEFILLGKKTSFNKNFMGVHIYAYATREPNPYTGRQHGPEDEGYDPHKALNTLTNLEMSLDEILKP